MGTFLAALVAFCGVIIAGYLSNFIAEDYKRFRDGSSVAAALSGELQSYIEGARYIRPSLVNMLQMIRGLSESQRLPVTKFEVPTDPVFDSSVEKLGLLGPDLAGDVAYVYQNLRAFRMGLSLYTEHHLTWDNARGGAQLEACSATNDRVIERGDKVLPALRARARQQYVMPHPRALIQWAQHD